MTDTDTAFFVVLGFIALSVIGWIVWVALEKDHHGP